MKSNDSLNVKTFVAKKKVINCGSFAKLRITNPYDFLLISSVYRLHIIWDISHTGDMLQTQQQMLASN